MSRGETWLHIRVENIKITGLVNEDSGKLKNTLYSKNNLGNILYKYIYVD